MSKLSEYFYQDLISFQNDPLKERFLIKNQFLKGYSGGFLCVAISENGKIMITGSRDKTVSVWDTNEKKRIACYTEHKGSVISVAISKDGILALSGPADKSVILWDLRNHSVIRTFYIYSQDQYLGSRFHFMKK